MAIGWLTVLKAVPWSDVISNAPAVADGAKKLWSAVGRKSASKEAASATGEELPANELSVAGLGRRQAAVETAGADLHQQMLASSELIKDLAEQNTQLIRRLETNRVRLIWLAAAVVAIGAEVVVLYLR